jgi:electron transfer flavoprotein beta subunit
VAYDIIVCIKQVPDTENLTTDAMKEDGTVNRAALPAIVNPEDMNALELALALKDTHGATVTVVTMGPPSAAEALRKCLYRGADRVLLLTDRKFAAADTLATSYALSCAIGKLGMPDLVVCGRQAIDGDTAQIGPQLAEKLGIPQFTYVEDIAAIDAESITVKRVMEHEWEVVRGPLPMLLTVTNNANDPRPPGVRKLMRFKRAMAPCEADGHDADALADRGLLMMQWSADDVGCEPEQCGLKGSPTRVKKIESVKLVTTERKMIEPTEDAIDALIGELMSEHIFD